jgi:hypothetical protein
MLDGRFSLIPAYGHYQATCQSQTEGVYMFGDALKSFFTLFFVMIPLAILGVWKFIEIIIWIVQHVHIGIV